MESSAGAEAPPVFECLRNCDDLRRVRFLVIVAHPDDEVIGAGARLPNLTSSFFVHVTTGSTRACSREATSRWSELMTAFDLARLSPAQLLPVCRLDQSLSHVLVGLTNQLTSLIAEQRPDAVLTHPYEGGHPDHDAIAFAVHAACRAITGPPTVIEMAFYHQGTHGIRTGEFLADGDTPTVTLQLSAADRAFKTSLLNCFPSQAHMLSYFGVATEKFRIAPKYDFTRPPHPGGLFYENFDWGIRSSAEWRTLAQEALVQLELQQ